MLCFSCENIEGAYEKTLKLGYKILFDFNVEENSKFFIYRDPNGVFIKLEEKMWKNQLKRIFINNKRIRQSYIYIKK